MKNGIKLLISISLSVLMVSCRKAADTTGTETPPAGRDASESLVPMSFDVSSETAPAGRTVLDGLSPFWQESDCLSVFGRAGTNAPFAAQTVSGTTAVFAGEADAEGPYLAVYPYSATNSVVGERIVAEVPSEQVVDGQNVAQGAMLAVSYAETAGSKFNFKNVVSIVKLDLATEGFTSITLVSNDGSALAGKVTVDPSTGEIYAVENASDKVVLRPVGTTFTPGVYHIAVIPGDKKGITVTMTRFTDKRKAEKTSSNTLSVARNTVRSIGEFAGGQLEWSYLIDSFADFKDYAGDADNWDEDGEIVTLRADIDMEMEAWTPITDTYKGTFEGGGHCIYNINLRSSKYNHLGVFGQYYKDVRNLTFGSKDGKTYDGKSEIYNSYNSDNSKWVYSAPITFSDGTIENVTNFMPVTVSKSCGNKSRTAGISAWTERNGVEILNCTNHAAIIVGASPGSDRNVNVAGILSGINSSNVTIKGCVNYGKIRSSSIYTKGIAGIVGLNYTASVNPLVEDCVNYGEIVLEYTDTQNEFVCVGGIMGRANCKAGNDPFRIVNCRNYGKVTGKGVHQQTVGGIVGRGDGVAIVGCINEGDVTIDHTTKASARFQAVGGILGGGMDGYGVNSVDNCINKGKVSMVKVASCGRESTNSSTKFYGVTAGGIIGVAAYVSSITGNKNYGSIDVTNEYSTKDDALMRPTAYVGGILGFDFAKVDAFATNWCDKAVTINVRTTYAASKNAEIRVGGVVGSLENSTMESGSGSSAITASNASASATVYAGSVAGYNASSIAYCGYGGTVNGAAASETNVVGGGNLPVACGPAGDEGSDKHDGGLDDMTGEEGVWD